ncbi:TetR/AcrR family transcriptional regulator [Actinomadura nitritigenes]|uniref:TetR/AcrR family transcriptional regulator n=1 Tax=Actinomadura nitritigenes TaxID=134602 RepID=UPI003D9113CA
MAQGRATHGNSTDSPPDAERDGGGRSTARRTLVVRELLETAARLFAERGYERTTLQDVAEAVGVSRSSLYHYVSSKEDLLSMLVEGWSRALADRFAEVRARADLSPEAKLRIFADTIVRQRAESPAQFRVLDQAEPLLPQPLREQHRQARHDVLDEVRGVIEAGVESGDFRPLDPRTAALSVLGMCNWVAWWFRGDEGQDVDPVARQITQSAVDIVTADHAAGGPGGSVQSALARVRADLDALETLLPTD